MKTQKRNAGCVMSNANKKTRVTHYALLLTLVVFCIGILTACARTVTPLINYGEQMSVEVTLAGTLEADANRYFLVLSANSNFQIPYFPTPDLNTPEFIEPGMIPMQGSAIDYYTKYFSTWAGYVVLDRKQFFSVRGPFSYGQAASREVLSNLGAPDAKIKFTFRLNRIFDIIPDTIYFDFVTVPWPDGAVKIPEDHINSTDAYISKVTGSIKAVDDLVEPGILPALNIVNCRVVIQ